MRVPRSALLIVRGETSRRKTIRVVTHEPIKVASRLRKSPTQSAPPARGSMAAIGVCRTWIEKERTSDRQFGAG